MKKNQQLRFALLSAALALGGCMLERGDFRGQETNARVELTKSNYRIVKSMVSGSDSGVWLLGIIPLTSPSVSEARREMYASSGLTFENRPLALVNQIVDLQVTYYVLFSIRKITISSDIVEFQPEGAK